MKKIILLFCFTVCIIGLLLPRQKKNTGYAEHDFVVVSESDTHGGFHGDGSYCLILDCSSNREKALETVKGWKPLPLSDNLSLIMYGGEKDGVQYTYLLAKDANIPAVKNGYFYFIDRQAHGTGRYSDSELFNRPSFNFSLNIYDTDTDMMYCYEFDT